MSPPPALLASALPSISDALRANVEGAGQVLPELFFGASFLFCFLLDILLDRRPRRSAYLLWWGFVGVEALLWWTASPEGRAGFQGWWSALGFIFLGGLGVTVVAALTLAFLKLRTRVPYAVIGLLAAALAVWFWNSRSPGSGEHWAAFLLASRWSALLFGLMGALLALHAVLGAAGKKAVGVAALIGCVVALWTTHLTSGQAPAGPAGGYWFQGVVFNTGYTEFFRYFCYAATALAIVMAMFSREVRLHGEGEYYYLLMAVGLAMAFLSMASNLLMIYVALESVSILSYGLAGYGRHNARSAEAGLKYVTYGAMASGVMLFGMSYLYGFTGTLDVAGVTEGMRARTEEAIAAATAAGLPDPAGAVDRVGFWFPMLIPLLMVFGGFAYKIAAFPFHMWAPDVYEGAPTSSTAFFSVGPKAAGFAVLMKTFLALFFGYYGLSWRGEAAGEPVWALDPQRQAILGYILAVIAIATMTLGNLIAIMQTNAKRMLAYSSIAHSGYMLAAVAPLAFTRQNDPLVMSGVEAAMLYLVFYLFFNLGAFFVVLCIENRVGNADIAHMAGLVRTAPGMVVAMAVFLFSLTGLPPLAGFMGKWQIFQTLLTEGDAVVSADANPLRLPIPLILAVAVAVNSVISLFYYLRIAKAMTIDQPAQAEFPRFPWWQTAVVWVLFAVPTLALFPAWSLPFDYIKGLGLGVLYLP
ncbi:MAG: NADH-quinone oxidoreductase subunit N [Planctomycetes bacterium]|nr:NADH-quinone oxidoreductase subunit N [Planctomycetota bacterium]